MATTLYFITENYLQSQTGISANVDATSIMPYVQPAAELHMSLILGREYFDALVAKYNAQTLTATEILLVAHVAPAVAWRAAVIAMPFNWVQWKNKGPQLQNGEYSRDIDEKAMAFMVKEYSKMAEYYENRVQKFLKLNEDDYPGWTADSNKDDTAPDETSSWDPGIMVI